MNMMIEEFREMERSAASAPWNLYVEGDEWTVENENETDLFDEKINVELALEARNLLPGALDRIESLEKAVEEAAEEIENCYGRDTELSIKLRTLIER